MVHKLKIWPEYFRAIITGQKRFEYRYFDRDYKVGDFLQLCEWDPQKEEFTGEITSVRVTYILEVYDKHNNKYCIMSLGHY